MQSLVKKWKNHLSENQMTYREHFVFAVGHGLGCFRAGLYLLCHGIFPCFYRSAGSKLIFDLSKDFTDHKKWIHDEKINNNPHE